MSDDALTDRIVKDFKKTVYEPNVQVAKRGLLDVIKQHGLGVALLVIHQRGLASGHIPLSAPGEPVRRREYDPKDKFVFVHVPVRALRRNRTALVARGIMNPYPDPNHLIYHEDGLVGTFSFRLSQIKDLYPALPPRDVVSDLLTCLEAQGLLEQARLDSWQVQFKDVDAKQRIYEDLSTHHQRVFVATGKRFDPSQIWLPADYDRPEIREILNTALAYKAPCNYCGVRELNPLEEITSTSLVPDWEQRYRFSMSRSYEFGFTFAPFGEPTEVCHFLAWDNPAISELVNNMDLQAYSFGDLIRLTCAINKDIEAYCHAAAIPFTPIVGVCNHWAGNSIYHQHYQFFRIPNLPLTHAEVERDVLVHHDVGLKVQRLSWPTPIYRVVMNNPVRVDTLSDLADAIAILWHSLSKPEERFEIGNEIVIDNNTQNTIVTENDTAAEVYFIPRLRSKLNAELREGVMKTNLAVLEVAGYLLIDDPGDWKKIDVPPISAERANLFGEGALHDVAPDDARIIEFEEKLQNTLSDQVRDIIEDIRDLAQQPCLEDIEKRIRRLLRHVDKTRTDKQLSPEAKNHILTEADRGYRKLTAQRNRLAGRRNKQEETLFTRETIRKLINEKP